MAFPAHGLLVAVPVALVVRLVLIRSVFVVGGRLVDSAGGGFVMSRFEPGLVLSWFWPQPAITVKITTGTPIAKNNFFFIFFLGWWPRPETQQSRESGNRSPAAAPGFLGACLINMDLKDRL